MSRGGKKLLETLIEARQRDARVVFDNNYRPRLWASIEEARAAYRSVLPYIDLALLTVDDEQALFDFSDCAAVFAAYEQMGTPEVVLKRGAEACLIRCDGESFEVPAQVVERVVDTTAAGGFVQRGVFGLSAQGWQPG